MLEPLLQVKNLVKRFGGLVATDHANLSVAPGEVHALIGPNGAGKTTLIHQISGALRSDEGAIIFDGADMMRTSMHARVHHGLARSYQITNVFKPFSVLDNVALAVQARSGSSLSFFRPAMAEAALFDEARAVLERSGLAHRTNDLAKNLAHGEQRQLELAVALATRPKLLLLDEPMAGMGPEESESMIELLLRLKESVTLLLVEHDMNAVFRLADRISVLVYGRIIATGSPEEIRCDPEVRKAYLGEEATA
jgi:branched-chain amino acid transport system ATP-binding protein